MRYALGLEYNGSNYSGWQRQKDRSSVQAELEKGLSQVANQEVSVTCAGRTDAGVHATNQVVHFDTDVSRTIYSWVKGVNSNLPHDVRVQWVKSVDDNFHARFKAVMRGYRYILSNQSEKPAILNGLVSFYPHALNMDNMIHGSQALLGIHDFSAFRSAGCGSKQPVREIFKIQITKHSSFYSLDFFANAFLQNMVRNLVGCLCWIGIGKQPIDWVAEVLAGCDRSKNAPTMPADGLYLTTVSYAPAFYLPSQHPITPLIHLADNNAD